ncbi:hypothetical protein GCM10007216_12240 [Thalassobacillus devorans]|uniref:Uncharacterized protein n=1 Tax=Thalassobacillus devorans TaxID=279813 RepID=A0ABQ1NRL9_9BACI|nr:hypothetical protein [Thalassobacillus devorans]NIK28835.1 hypothetical protein [Thalassobacillus devorans]GGC83195.1 hypothetical protein GCM10007216_12240 [Thalassobacillus devorans]
MKKVIFLSLPFLLIGLTFAAMFEVKRADTPYSQETKQVEEYIEEAAESVKPADGAAATIEEVDMGSIQQTSANDEPSYSVEKQKDSVSVFDDQDNKIFETTLEDWNKNKDYYHEKYRIEE